LQLANTDQI